LRPNNQSMPRREALKRSMATILAVGCIVGLGATSVGAAPRAKGPCGTARPSKVHFRHVIWILEENHSFGSIIGNPQAPYINALARTCGLATNYHNITHPSLPNYVGATSGLGLAQLTPFKVDCTPSAACSTGAKSIFAQSSSWKSYADSMPSNCYKQNRGNYAPRHNPALYYTKLRGCARKDVPYARLASDLAHGHLPAFSFITPNLVHDMHNGTIAQGDAWLKTNLRRILRSRAYKSDTTAVFITWDEGEGGTSQNCATNTTDIGCRVATIVISPSTKPGTKSGRLFNHYSLLRTTEQLLGRPALGDARRANSMRRAFGL
jgi:phospholipase C